MIAPFDVRCRPDRSEEHTSELQSRSDLVCRLLLEKKKEAWLLLRRTGMDPVKLPPRSTPEARADLVAASGHHVHDDFGDPGIHELLVFFFNDTAPTEIYPLSLHDALPISGAAGRWPPGPGRGAAATAVRRSRRSLPDRKSTRLNSSHDQISYAVFCLQ